MPPSQTCSGTPRRLCTSARMTRPAGRIRARARSTPKRREIVRGGFVRTSRSASASSSAPSVDPTRRRAARALPPTARAASTRGGSTPANATPVSTSASPVLVVAEAVAVEPRRQPHGAEVDRAHPVRHPAGRPDGDLGRGSADVADRDRARQLDRRGGDGASVGEPALLLRGEDANRNARRTRQRGHERVRVAALPAGRGDEHVERLDPLLARDGGELPHRLRRCGHVDVGDDAVALDLLAERETNLLLVERNDLTALHARDEQTRGVRADVEDPDTH